MRCESAKPLLELHLDGSLPEELARQLEVHLLRCAECAHVMRAAEQALSQLKAAVPRAESSASYRERTQARLLEKFVSEHPIALAPSPGQWKLPLQ